MEKVCSGSILCSTWGQQKGGSRTEPHMQAVASHSVHYVTVCVLQDCSPALTLTSVSGMWCFPSPGRSNDTRYSLVLYRTASIRPE